MIAQHLDTMLPLTLLALLPAVLASPSQYIIGGTEVTDAAKWPWQGSLEFGGSHSCGCVLLSENWILTAAHCIGFEASRYTVRFGNLTRGQGTLYEISQVIQHEDFRDLGTPGSYPNDVGLMVPATPVVMTETVQAVALDSAQSTTNCWITGWGQTDVGVLPSPIPDQLQEASTDILTDAQAEEAWGRNYNGDVHLCVQDLQNFTTGACSGDSGGPLVCEVAGGFEVRGVTSWGIASCDPEFPSTYTRLFNFRQWVCDNTAGELGC